MKKSTLCLAVMTALVASGARAVETAMPESQPKAEESRTGTPAKPVVPGQERQSDRLALEFGVEKDEVMNLREKGLGWGEVRHVLMLSRETGKPAEDIVKMHEDGMSWGDIAKKEGVKLDRMGRPEKRGATGSEQKPTGYERGMPESEPGAMDRPERDRGTRGSDRGNMQREPRPSK